MSIKRVTQLELENFATGIDSAEEADGQDLLAVDDLRARELLFKTILIKDGKLTSQEEIPSWADVYQKLLNAKIRPRIAAFIAWSTMPKKYRWPETQEKLAKEVLGLTSDRVIATWRKRFPEIDMMISELQAEEMLEYRPGAMHALGSVAADPSYRANPDRKLFFEMTGDHVPRQKIETSKGNGVGRRLLQMLDKVPSDQLVESFGADAKSIIEQLKLELDEEEALGPLPSASPQMEDSDLEGDDDMEDEEE